MLKNEKPGGEPGTPLSISEENDQESTKKLELNVVSPHTIDESKLASSLDYQKVNIKSTKILDIDMMTDQIAKQ